MVRPDLETLIACEVDPLTVSATPLPVSIITAPPPSPPLPSTLPAFRIVTKHDNLVP